ncbi:MAG: DUF2950 domain-containing protein [Aestuariivirga sp.]|uniref:DUF2950 domain-containing protein n=1 Tax=Aestuariivirga sp. TaxID=2650926 RepID=UPI0025C10EDD|nr:DUF2950 domain-containing protein [Aestuariivirga sp.]MCA3560722.1 DUF2950 domain-containing protein [Aestuariivirga sp.]
MINTNLVSTLLLGTAVVFGQLAAASPAFAISNELQSYVGPEPTLFDTPEAAIAAFKDVMAKGDINAISALLGLDAAKVAKSEDIEGTVKQVQEAASEGISVEEEEDQRVLDLGKELWPFPFPVVKGEDGKWAFDTVAGLEEIVNRRIGENELHAIDTMRLYVQAQEDYATEDRDGDGVLEFAQKLISSEGRTDGLYWPPEQGDGESLVGSALDAAALDKAKAGDGYFGYKFRILKRQGGNIAGGAHDYVVNGNMISGFALLAWPARYGETGVSTFVVNQAGVVYERDFGPGTDSIVPKILSFNPGGKWDLASD